MMKSEEKDVDYAEFYLKAQKEFKQIADCVNKREYFQAEKHAMNAMVDMKMLWNSLIILKEKHLKLWRNNEQG